MKIWQPWRRSGGVTAAMAWRRQQAAIWHNVKRWHGNINNNGGSWLSGVAWRRRRRGNGGSGVASAASQLAKNGNAARNEQRK